MGRLHIIIDDSVERRLRTKVVRKKGDISDYIQSLIEEDFKKMKGGKKK